MIKEQRRSIRAHLKETPSLKTALVNETWFEGVWADALACAIDETGLDGFPEDCQWSIEQMLDAAFYPDAGHEDGDS